MTFKKGQSGNPNGRPKGARSQFSEKFVQSLAEDWEAHGAKALVKTREESPSQYLRVCASLVPKGIELSEAPGTEEMLSMGPDGLARLRGRIDPRKSVSELSVFELMLVLFADEFERMHDESIDTEDWLRDFRERLLEPKGD